MTKPTPKTASTATLQVDIVSDVICPWCWLGKRYFDQAVTISGQKIAVTWRPYMLDPTVPMQGVPYKDYMAKKFGKGPSDRFKAMRAHLETAAPEAGITFRFSQIPMRPNTLNAHRVIRWAGGQGLADQAVEALFKAAFDDVDDIGDLDVLTRIANDIGLDPDITKDLLQSSNDTDAVNEEIDFFRRLGISGVPTFIYNGQLAVQGAQPAEHHLNVMKEAAKLPPPNS